jgi:hypothetical protein
MKPAKDLTREDLLVRLAEVIADRDALATELNRERILFEDLRRELTGLRMFRLRVGELTHSTFTGQASDEAVIGEAKEWLAFYRRVAGLCPWATSPESMLGWIRIIKDKAAEYDRTTH